MLPILAINTHNAIGQDLTDSFFKCPPDVRIYGITRKIGMLHFKANAHKDIDFGITGEEYHYLIIKLTARQPVANRFLTIDNTSLDTINIYRLFPDGDPVAVYRGGQLVSHSQKNNFVWHTIAVETGFAPSYYLIALKAAQKNINLRYGIYERDKLIKKYLEYNRIVFFYIGIAFMISAIILLAWGIFRLRVFGTYLCYIICISVWILSHYGILFPALYPQLPSLNDLIKPVSSLLAAVFLLWTLEIIFQKHLMGAGMLKRITNLTRVTGVLLSGLMTLLITDTLTVKTESALIGLWHLALLVMMFFIVLIPLKYFNTGRPAKIFSGAMIIIALSTLLQLLTNSHTITNHFVEEHGMAVGSLIENSLMAFGLLYGLITERRTRDLQLRALEMEQTETLRKLLSLEDKERKRIASDLHDNIGPLLAALKINFRRITAHITEEKRIELIEKTESIIDDSISEIRNLAHNLMPKSLLSNGLTNSLAAYFDDLEPLYNTHIDFTHQLQHILSERIQISIYRVVSELVLNAAKHADASTISVHLKSDTTYFQVCIKDNGHGFERQKNENRPSLGLQSAESRVKYLGGSFSLITAPGKGTSVNTSIPL